jgi:stage V sporulation protein G
MECTKGKRMRITDVRVKLVPPTSQDRLAAYCSMTLDGAFVVRDIKVIDGPRGLFVAMPSTKLTDSCPSCRFRNHLRAKFCGGCGRQLDPERAIPPNGERVKLFSDVAHPINAATRLAVQDALIVAYRAELTRSKMPDYIPAADVPEDVDR